MEIHQATQHRWQYILPRIGIEPRYLRNTHQPCPLCGGKDRFRFDDKDGMGTYFCNQCGAGDGFKLIMNLLHCDFKHAASIVESYLGNGWVNAHPIAPTPAKTQEKPEKQQDKQDVRPSHPTSQASPPASQAIQ